MRGMDKWIKDINTNPQKLARFTMFKIVSDWRKDLDNIPHGIVRGILFSGDRFTCCNEAVVAYDGDTFVGIATISFKGEDYKGKPEVVGLYVSPLHRNQGYGLELFKQALLRCFDVADRVQVVAVSANVRSLVEKLPESIKAKVDFVDCSLGLNLVDS
jgi:GNAT superfamily N-acetyltransferase